MVHHLDRATLRQAMAKFFHAAATTLGYSPELYNRFYYHYHWTGNGSR